MYPDARNAVDEHARLFGGFLLSVSFAVRTNVAPLARVLDHVRDIRDVIQVSELPCVSIVSLTREREIS